MFWWQRVVLTFKPIPRKDQKAVRGAMGAKLAAGVRIGVALESAQPSLALGSRGSQAGRWGDRCNENLRGMLTPCPRRGVMARRRTVGKARKMQAKGAKDAPSRSEGLYGVGATFQSILSPGAMILMAAFLRADRLLRLGFGLLRSVVKKGSSRPYVKIRVRELLAFKN